MTRRSIRLQEAFKQDPAPARRVTPPLDRNTHTTVAAGAHRPSQHSGGPLRLLAARLIQEQVLRIGRAAHAVEDDLATLLHRLVARRVHRDLGYRRLSDYLEDRPGLPLAACRRLVQRDRARTGETLGTSLFAAPSADERAAGAAPAGEPRAMTADFDVWMEVTRAVREALQPLGPGTGADGPAQPPAHSATRAVSFPALAGTAGSAPGLFDATREDAPGLDAAIRDRVGRAQALAWRRARLLAAAARYHLYTELGYASLEEWAAHACGLSAGGLCDLLWMERMLGLHPAIEDAFRRGRLTWSRAIHASRAARPETERAWVREARRLPIERLRRASEAACFSRRGGMTAG